MNLHQFDLDISSYGFKLALVITVITLDRLNIRSIYSLADEIPDCQQQM